MNGLKTEVISREDHCLEGLCEQFPLCSKIREESTAGLGASWYRASNRVHYVAPSVAWSLVALGLVGRISPKQANQTHNHQKPWRTLCIPWSFVFVLCKMNVLLVKVKRGCAPISHCAVRSTEGKLKIRGSFQTYSKCNHQVWMHCIRWS